MTVFDMWPSNETPQHSFRYDAEKYRRAKAIIAERGETMTSFLTGHLDQLIENADAVDAELDTLRARLAVIRKEVSASNEPEGSESSARD